FYSVDTNNKKWTQLDSEDEQLPSPTLDLFNIAGSSLGSLVLEPTLDGDQIPPLGDVVETDLEGYESDSDSLNEDLPISHIREASHISGADSEGIIEDPLHPGSPINVSANEVEYVQILHTSDVHVLGYSNIMLDSGSPEDPFVVDVEMDDMYSNRNLQTVPVDFSIDDGYSDDNSDCIPSEFSHISDLDSCLKVKVTGEGDIASDSEDYIRQYGPPRREPNTPWLDSRFYYQKD
ncbi:hypothetical protein Moror_13011, partial [Moniliophthora roreri MCA 2997]